MPLLSIELLTFTFSLWALMAVKKRKFPEMFFPPAGVTVFRPPEEEDLKLVREHKDQQGKNLNRYKKQLYQTKKPMLPVRFQNATSKAFENVKYMADLELAVMMTYVIIIVSICSFTVQKLNLLPSAFNTPNLSFYLTFSFLLVFIYNLVKISMVGGLSIYENKLSAIISVLTGILLSVLLLAGRGIIDINFERAFSLQIYQMRSLLNAADQNFSSFKIDIAVLVFIGLFMIFIYSFVPVIIKYGNSYIGVTKEVFRLEAQAQKEEIEEATLNGTQGTGDLNAASSQDKSDSKKQGGKESDTLSQLRDSQRTLRWLNLGLVFHLLAIFCWLKPITSTWNAHLNDKGLGLEVLRVTFILMHLGTLLLTYKAEISRYMLRVYDNITSLLSDPSSENLAAVRRRTDAHLRYMGVMSYQVVMKIITPFIILLLFLNKRIALEEQAKDQVTTYYNMDDFSYLDWNCYGIKDPLEIIGQAYVCPVDRRFEIVAVENGLGILSSENQYQSEGPYGEAKDALRKVQKYGLIHNEFWYMALSLWLFLHYLVTYILTVIYIFYRKTIEQV